MGKKYNGFCSCLNELIEKTMRKKSSKQKVEKKHEKIVLKLEDGRRKTSRNLYIYILQLCMSSTYILKGKNTFRIYRANE